MVIQTPRNSNQQYKAFAYAERKADDEPCCVLSSTELERVLGINKKQTARLFTRLVKDGRIQQLQRGVYLFPGRLPPGKKWKPSPYLALAHYMNWKKATWQISGLDALSRHGFTTQIPQSLFVYNDVYSGEKEVGGSQFIFVKVPKTKLGHIVTFSIPGSQLKLIYSSKARVVFDMFFEQARVKMLGLAINAVRLSQNDKSFLNELIECALRYGNKASQQRIGFVLSSLGVNGIKLKILRKDLGKNVAAIPLFPPSRKGHVNKEWGIIETAEFGAMAESDEVPT